MKRVLIANRGEIAVRIIRTAKELGLETVAIFSTADRESLHVKLADRSICIGPPQPSKSYLYVPNIISAALLTNSDALHPGYGFLAENWRFAEIVESHDIRFIGPKPEHIRAMGDKLEAKAIASKAGVSLLPSSPGLEDIREAKRWAREIGYPVIIKASAGGGGRGMRIVNSDTELEEQFPRAQMESKVAFGSGTLYLEKYIPEAKHVEVQVFGDTHGNAIHLFERECSAQRRYQKIIEESPANIPEEVREELYSQAVSLVSHMGYVNAGTIEFIYDVREKKFYFIEMNTRIQVEHPVTEMITGMDLVKLQFMVANGRSLPPQESIMRRGHAIEVRITAEDPERNFLPSAGKIEWLKLPGGFGVRVDTHIYPGYEIPPHYDSMIAKLIVWGENRLEAISRLHRALDEIEIVGLKTNIEFLKKVISTEEFVTGRYTTKFLDMALSGYFIKTT